MSNSYVGKSVERVDAFDKVNGNAIYPADTYMENMVYADVILAGRPKARIKSIDPSQALALPGVLAVLTAADVPQNVCGLIMPDQTVLCDDLVHHAGDKVAVVVAENQEILQKAVKKVHITYEDLPGVFDPQEALLPTAPLVHPQKSSNLIMETAFSFGDVDTGFEQADVIVQNTYHTGSQEHAFMAPEAGTGYLDDEGRITIETAGQWAHDDLRQIAAALGLAEDRVRVIYNAIGGAFGGREDVSVQILIALVVYKFQRSVKMVWTRRQSLLAHHKRHPMTFNARLGAKKDGTLVAAEVEVLGDGGAYVSTSMPVLANAMLFCTGPYHIPNVRVHGKVVYTNNLPSGAMRGFGALQGNFCAEMQISHLAAELGIGPVSLREKNLIDRSSRLPNGALLPEGVEGISQSLTQCARKAGWVNKPDRWEKPDEKVGGKGSKAYGKGFACGWKNVGLGGGVPDACETIIELHGKDEIERVVIRNAAADVGQGVETVLMQITAEVIGIPLEFIECVGSDTAESPPSGTASASRLTFMAGNATYQAAQKALLEWQNEERPAIGYGKYEPPNTKSIDSASPKDLSHYSLGYTAGDVEIEVDLETGVIRLLSVVSAFDAGKAINPQQVVGQAHGGIAQSIGWALTEKIVLENGKLITADFANYLIPTSLDMPEKFECIIIETPDRYGPYGARGIGELPMLTIAPAILSAIHDATGVWLSHVPVFAEDVWKAIQGKGN